MMRTRRTGWSTRQHVDDLAFLAKLRAMVEAKDVDGLYDVSSKHQHKSAPQWKRVAIARAIVKASAKEKA